MFQWLMAACACKNINSVKNGFNLSSNKWALLLLLVFQFPDIAVAESLPPVWTVPIQQTSDDGYALLAWESAGREEGRFFRITETFDGKTTVHYTESTELRAWRVEPGEYEFVLQSCVKNSADALDCGDSSGSLTLRVSEVLTSALFADPTVESSQQTTGENVSGGPHRLRPGHWYNPAKDGHGWSFYWSNRLALPKDDPLFGNNYDLVGIWYTHEAKQTAYVPGCSSCPAVPSAYRPVVLTLKAVSTGSGSYGGSLYVSRNDGSEVWVGSAEVIFGSDSTGATVNWNADFQKESLSDSDPLVLLLSSDTTDAANISHFSGVWKRSGDNSFLVLDNIGETAEVVDIVFYDDAGSPTWIEAVNPGSAVSGSTSFCLAYLQEGYSPKADTPSGWIQNWHMSGCDPEQAIDSTNRNGRRYFSGLDNEYIWADFTLPGTESASGSISIGTSSAAVELEKAASFHGVTFDSTAGSSCELTDTAPACDVQLTWYTAGNYPNATVFAHNISNNTYQKVMTSGQSPVVDLLFKMTRTGLYEFELRMGFSEDTTLMAVSKVFTVKEGTVGSQPETPPAPAKAPVMTASNSSSEVGTTEGAFRVVESGSASYSIPILTAPASGGVGPQISLNYDSKSGNSEVGVGWSIGGVSAISLCPQTMEQDAISGSRGLRLDGTDRFCLDGQRLVVDSSSGEYGKNGTQYRTEIDSFARITSYGSAGNGPAWFKVEHKDGSVVEYGNSADSRIEARGSVTPATIFTWAQNRFEDRSGNYILYSYLENSSGPVAFVLQTIDYTGNVRAGTLPSARLSFTYRDRSSAEDLVVTYIAGVELEQRHLLQSIRSQGRLNAGSPLEDLRFYELSYEQDGIGRNILTAFTECRSVSRSTCYPPTRFGWLKSESKIDIAATVQSGLLPRSTLSGLLLAEVSGDGRPDLLYTTVKKRKHFLYVKEATADAGFSEWPTSYQLPKKADGSSPRVFAIDLNSDGIQDVAYSKYRKSSKDYSWVALISNGSGFSAEIELNPDHRFFLTGQELESRFQVMDFNGDGLSDILHAHTDVLGGSWHLTVLLNISVAGGGPALSAPIELDVTNADLFPFDVSGGWGMDIQPPYFDWATEDVEKKEIPDARVFDFNGDGAVDLLLKVWRHYRSCVANCGSLSATTNNESQTGKFKDPVYEYRFASFWVLMESNGRNAFTRHSIVAMGDGCTLAAICQNPEYDDLPRSDYVWPVDINADGLADLAWGDTSRNWYFQLNTGNGFAAPKLINQVPEGVNELVRFEDWNGDSYPDLIYPSRILYDNAQWMINQNHFGRAYAAASNTLVLAGNVGGDRIADPVENDASVFADFNGDGKTDQLLINNNKDGEILSSSIRKGMNVSGSREVEPANVITTITNGFGAVTDIFYKPLTDNSVYSRMHDSINTDWGNGSAVYDLIAPIYVVSQVQSSAPVYNNSSAHSQVQYHYIGAKLQAGGRGFLGFGEVISYNPQSQIRTNSRYRQDFPFTGLLIDTTRVSNAAGSRFSPVSDTGTRETTNWGEVSSSTTFPSQVSGTPLAYSLNQWRFEPTTGAAVFPTVTDSIEIAFTLEGDLDRKTLTASNYDAYGNLLSAGMSVYDAGGSFFAGETSSSTYSNNLTKWFIGQRSTTRVTYSRSGQSSITRHSSFKYDPVSGILSQEVTEPNSNTFRITTDYLLDNFGNRKQTTVTAANMPPRKVIERYDSLGRYVNESLNALNQTTQKTIARDVFGNSLEMENIDGVVTIGAADFMGKPFVSFTETGVWSKALAYSGTGSNCPLNTRFYTSTITGGKPNQVHCYDLLGRLSRTAIEGLDGNYIYTDQFYDSSGRVSRVSEPYLAGNQRYWNINSYDDLGRITAVLSAGGDDITHDYDSRAANQCFAAASRVTVINNGLNQQRVEVRNAKGETEAVYDDKCGLVSYEYDARGNLKMVTGADGETVRMSYDLAGRKIAMNDPDKGYWQYSYNALGELKRQLDSKNQAIDFSYDVLGRVTDRRELTGVSSLNDTLFTTANRESTTYLVASPGKGQIASVVYRSGELGTELHRKAFTYDSFGRVDLVTTTVGADQFVQQVTYDQYSRVFQQFDASGDDRGLRYVYSNGYVSRLKEAREGLSGTVYQDIRAMDARGNVTHLLLGNGVDVYANYEPDTGKLARLSAFDASGVELMNVDYLFDVLGNLKQRHDLSVATDLKEEFGYDTLNRLKSVNLSVNAGAAVQSLTMDYDASGNIVYKSDVGIYYYDGPQPHALSSAGGVSYSYDNNGNQVFGGGRTISYTVFDKPKSISRGTNRTGFSYGVGNKRFQREDYQGEVLQKRTLYLGAVERISGNGSTFFKRYLGGVAIATYYPASGAQQLTYLLKDHIGSIHSVLDESGLISATMHFSAFGKRQAADWKTPLTSFLYSPLNDITTRGFTGHEQVDSVGIIHMNGRIYDPSLGRFLQADPIVQAPNNSQSLNRYSYVLNNPLSSTDPSGYFSLKKFFKRWGPVIVAAVASYFTFGAASGWAFGLMPSTAAGVATSGAYTASAVIGGAVGGFVGGAIVSRSLKGAVRGALIGALFAYVGDRIATGVQNWRQGRGNVWRITYDETTNKFTKEFISDTSIIQIDDLFVNGQAGGLDKSIELGIQQLGKQKEFFLFHNPTHGFIADTVESTLGKLNKTSGLSRQLAGILEQHSQSITSLTAHSQGSIIVSNALRQVTANSLTVNTVVNFNGAAVSPKVLSQTASSAGATKGIYQAHFFDPVPNLFGQGTANPFRIIGSFLAFPFLFMGPELSPHTVYTP